MKTFRHFKKLLWIIGILLLVLFSLNFGISYWIKSNLNQIIEEQNDTAYVLEFEDLSFSIFSAGIKAANASVMPRKGSDIEHEIDFSAKIKTIELVGVNFIRLLRDKDLAANRIYIKNPDIRYFKPLESRERDSLESKLGEVIDIDRFIIEDGFFTMVSTDGMDTISQLHRLNIDLKGVSFQKKTPEKNFSFSYDSYDISCDSIYYVINDLHYIKSDKITLKEDDFILKRFKLKPTMTRKEFKDNSINESSLLDIEVPLLHINSIDWEQKNHEIYVTADSILSDSIDIKLLDSKTVKKVITAADDAVVKPFLGFNLNIGKIKIKNAAFSSKENLKLRKLNFELNTVSHKINQQFDIQTVNINNPVIDLSAAASTPKKTGKNAKNLKEMVDVFKINRFNINQATLHYTDKPNDIRLNAGSINVALHDVTVNNESLQSKIPFYYQDVHMTAGETQILTGFYRILSKKTDLQNHNLALSSFSMKPTKTRAQIVRQLKTEKDIFDLSASKIQLNNYKYGFNESNNFYLDIAQVLIQNMDAKIYRSKIPKDDMTFKPLYSKQLRDLGFQLDVDELKVVDSKLSYEEETEKSDGAGKLSFYHFNAVARNIKSAAGRSRLPDVKIDVQTRFMNATALNVNWSFNVLNRQDKFNINGVFRNFPAENLTPFIRPYMKVTAEGMLDEVQFNFNGNNNIATGTFGLKHHNLKISIYNDDGKKRKFLSGVANIFVKSGKKGNYNEVNIKDVERKHEKGFFNFFWLCLLQGLKQTLI